MITGTSHGVCPPVRFATIIFESAVFDVNVTFASNVFNVNLLGKVLLLRAMTLYITTVKQVVLVMKEWYFTVIEGPSTIPKQLVLL